MTELNPKITPAGAGKVKMTWTPDPSVFGYRFYVNDHPVSKSVKPGQASTTFAWDGQPTAFGIAAAYEKPAETVLYPAPPVTPMVFDGRASKQTFLPASGSAYHATPSTPVPGNDEMWNCIYLNSDITLVDDPSGRWKKHYAVRLTKNSKNPWGVPPLGSWQGPGSISAELTHVRTVAPNQVDWYALSYRPHEDWVKHGFQIISQLGYPTLSSPPIGVNVARDSIGIDLDGGILTQAGHPGWWGGTNSQRYRWPVADTAGSWVDLVIGVEWTLDNTGWVFVQSRCLDHGETWITRLDSTGIPTYQQHPNIPASIPWKAQCMDKQGGYVGYDPVPPDNWVAHVDLRGLSRHVSRADAESIRKVAAYDAARAEVKREGLSRAEYVLRAEAAEAERDEANVQWHRIRDLHGEAIKDLRAVVAERDRLREAKEPS